MKKRLIMLLGAIFIVLTIICFWGFFRPVDIPQIQTCDYIEISPVSSDSIKIVDTEDIDRFLDLYNSATYRKAFRIPNEAPDNLFAVVQIISAKKSATDVVLLVQQESYSVYVKNDAGAFLPYHPDALCKHIVDYLD